MCKDEAGKSSVWIFMSSSGIMLKYVEEDEDDDDDEEETRPKA